MPNNEIEIYQSKDDQTQVEVTFEDESVWLNQKQLSALFERDRTVIGRHVRNIFKEGELEEDVVCADFAHTTQHGAIEGKTQTKTTKYFNLDVIISVGYRVKSIRGTQFRQWANQRLKDYLIKGFEQNDFYPSIEEKAAMLLYLIIKNHAFADGNKRIAAACFLMFLQYNNLLVDSSEITIISNEALASLTLFCCSQQSSRNGNRKESDY